MVTEDLYGLYHSSPTTYLPSATLTWNTIVCNLPITGAPGALPPTGSVTSEYVVQTDWGPESLKSCTSLLVSIAWTRIGSEYFRKHNSIITPVLDARYPGEDALAMCVTWTFFNTWRGINIEKQQIITVLTGEQVVQLIHNTWLCMISASSGSSVKFGCNHPSANVDLVIVEFIADVVTWITLKHLLKDLVNVQILVFWDCYSQTEHSLCSIPAR